MSTQSYYNVSGGFGAIASSFVQDSLGHMIPWLIVMAALVVADLFAGIAKSLKLRVKVRFSKACRDTMAKFCTYFAVVVVFCFYEVASHTGTNYAEYACFFVMIIEAASIASNILKFHGYDVDMNKLFALIFSKKFDVDKEEIEDVIKKGDNE